VTRKVYDHPMPATEAYFQARGWAMPEEQRNLLLAILSPDGSHLDPMDFITGATSQWFYSYITPTGRLHVWCPIEFSSSTNAHDHDGTWVSVHNTNFAERFNEANLPVPHAAS
jgi:hypothetical protein